MMGPPPLSCARDDCPVIAPWADTLATDLSAQGSDYTPEDTHG